MHHLAWALSGHSTFVVQPSASAAVDTELNFTRFRPLLSSYTMGTHWRLLDLATKTWHVYRLWTACFPPSDIFRSSKQSSPCNLKSSQHVKIPDTAHVPGILPSTACPSMGAFPLHAISRSCRHSAHCSDIRRSSRLCDQPPRTLSLEAINGENPSQLQSCHDGFMNPATGLRRSGSYSQAESGKTRGELSGPLLTRRCPVLMRRRPRQRRAQRVRALWLRGSLINRLLALSERWPLPERAA